ncbi:MAG TPA: zinc ribbon domain-containing protein [Pyrinomonadaceae bacterium]|nr:zinc ribbon domain-containing protein [Pyrinomonadaceae bacterium]
MICQNCRAEVDDDLIFCTNCGARLMNSQTSAQTVLINDPAATQKTVNPPPPKSASNFKWIALIIALVAIPASIFGVYLLMRQNRPQVSQNVNKTATPVSTPARKANTNQNSNANPANSNVNSANSNVTANTNSAKTANKIEVMNERIEIAPKSHYAVPFEIENENVKLVGEAKLLEGEKITGFVYLQKNYDEYFPDPTYKMFSFEGKKSAEIDAPLVEEEYVLIFVNETDKPMIIQGNFSLK